MIRKMKFWKEESGQTLVMFALVLIVLCFFIGLSIDLNMVYKQRNAMQTSLQVVRDNRFTYQDSIRYADNPGSAVFKVVSETLAENGCDEDTQLRVYFKEDDPRLHYRAYQVRVEISQEFDWYFLSIFGKDSSTITTYLDGGESYGDGAIENIWHPVDSPTVYNGCYYGKVGSGVPEGHTSQLPEEW